MGVALNVEVPTPVEWFLNELYSTGAAKRNPIKSGGVGISNEILWLIVMRCFDQY